MFTLSCYQECVSSVVEDSDSSLTSCIGQATVSFSDFLVVDSIQPLLEETSVTSCSPLSVDVSAVGLITLRIVTLLVLFRRSCSASCLSGLYRHSPVSCTSSVVVLIDDQTLVTNSELLSLRFLLR